MSTILERHGASTDGRNEQVLRKLVAAIRVAYGTRIERIVLFGSRARGDAKQDSDFDLAIFIHDLEDRQAEIGTLWDIERSVIRAEDPIFELIPFPAGSWRDPTPFMREVRQEGIYKRLGDYEIGPASAISATDAQTAIKEAHRFVTIVRSQLP